MLVCLTFLAPRSIRDRFRFTRTLPALAGGMLALLAAGCEDGGTDALTPTTNTGVVADGGAMGGGTTSGSTGTTGGATTATSAGTTAGVSTGGGTGAQTSSTGNGGSMGDGGATGTDAGATGGEDAGGTTGPANPELCHLEGSQVVILGDSYIALDPSFVLLDTHPFVRNLEDLARSAGALAEGDGYRSHALSGASMAHAPFIPGQLDDAINNDPDIKLVIMTGGGNDILVNNRLCLEYGTEEELLSDQGCVDAVDNALVAGQEVFDRGVEAGVQAAVYFFYPHLPGLTNGGIGAGTYPNLILDYAYPQVRDLCERQTAIPCYFIDMRPVFDQDGDDLPDPGMINIDGIHPTAESSQLMAEAVWEVMQEQCLASE